MTELYNDLLIVKSENGEFKLQNQSKLTIISLAGDKQCVKCLKRFNYNSGFVGDFHRYDGFSAECRKCITIGCNMCLGCNQLRVVTDFEIFTKSKSISYMCLRCSP